jgi:hypothetical protein
VLQTGFFVALVAPWHHTHRVGSWQGRRGGRNPGGTRRVSITSKTANRTQRWWYELHGFWHFWHFLIFSSIRLTDVGTNWAAAASNRKTAKKTILRLLMFSHCE